MNQFHYKIWKFPMGLSVFIALFLCNSVYCARMSEDEAAEIAKLSYWEKIGGEKNSFLTCQRDVGLERAFAKFINKSHENIPYIFRVNPEGKEVKENVVTHHGLFPYRPDCIIAISDSLACSLRCI